MPDIKWIKITTEMFDDEKIRIIEAMPEADTLIVIWIRLICMAGKVNAGGLIFLAPDLPYNEEELAAIFGRPLNTVRLAIATFQRLHMLEMADDGIIFLLHFEAHQSITGMERIRDNTRKRVQAFRDRERHKLLASPDAAPLRNVTVTEQSRLDKSRREESRENDYLFTTWINILNKLKSTINESNYNLFYKEAVCVKITDTTLKIVVPNEFHAKYIEEHQRSLIEKLIHEETGQNLELQITSID